MAAADAAIAAELGVAPTIVEALRKEMVLGVHWTREATGRVVFTEAGLKELRSKLSLPEKEDAPLFPVSRAFTLWLERPANGHAAVLATIVRCHPNPLFVRVVLPDRSQHDVRVRNNGKLQLKQKLRCRQLEDGRWECVHTGQAVRLPTKSTLAAAG